MSALCTVSSAWARPAAFAYVTPDFIFSWITKSLNIYNFAQWLPRRKYRHQNMLMFSGLWKYSRFGNNCVYTVFHEEGLLRSHCWFSWQDCSVQRMSSTQLPSATSSFVNGSFSGTCPGLILSRSSLDSFRMTSLPPASVVTGLSYISY